MVTAPTHSGEKLGAVLKPLRKGRQPAITFQMQAMTITAEFAMLARLPG